MIFNLGKNESIKLYRIIDKNGNYLCGYRTIKDPKKANLYDEKMAKIICEDDNGKSKIEPVFVTITVTEKNK